MDTNTFNTDRAVVWGNIEKTRPAGWTKARADMRADVSFKKLARFASKLRGGIGCTIEPDDFISGVRHVVVVLKFEDGVCWIARVAVRSAPKGASLNFLSDADTQTILSERGLPVPEMYDYHPCDCLIGRPFMLMQLLPGYTMRQLIEMQDRDAPTKRRYDEWIRTDKFLRSTANFQVRLSSVRAYGMGRMRRHEDGGIEIHPRTGSRYTYTYLAQYLHAWAMIEEHNWTDSGAEAYVKGRFEGAEEKARAWTDSRNFPVLLKEIAISLHSNMPPLDQKKRFESDPIFPIVHMELGTWNVVVDEDEGLLGVIDWEGATTVPWELVDVPPCVHSPMEELQSHEETGEQQAKLISRRAQTVRYIRYVEEAEHQLGSDNRLSGALKNRKFRCLSQAMSEYKEDGLAPYNNKLRALFGL